MQVEGGNPQASGGPAPRRAGSEGCPGTSPALDSSRLWSVVTATVPPGGLDGQVRQPIQTDVRAAQTKSQAALDCGPRLWHPTVANCSAPGGGLDRQQGLL